MAARKPAPKKRTRTGQFAVTFTAAKRQEVLAMIAKGVPVKAACAHAGVHHATYYRALELARQAEELRETDPDVKLTREQLDAIDFLAEAEYMASGAQAYWHMRFVTESEKPQKETNWMPVLRMLACRWPAEYAEKTAQLIRNEFTGANGGPIEVVTRAEIEGAADRLRQKLAPVLELDPARAASNGHSNGNGGGH